MTLTCVHVWAPSSWQGQPSLATQLMNTYREEYVCATMHITSNSCDALAATRCCCSFSRMHMMQIPVNVDMTTLTTLTCTKMPLLSCICVETGPLASLSNATSSDAYRNQSSPELLTNSLAPWPLQVGSKHPLTP